jgi:hypothetical protein
MRVNKKMCMQAGFVVLRSSQIYNDALLYLYIQLLD